MKEYRFFVPLICACLASAMFQGCSTPSGQSTPPPSIQQNFPPLPDGLTNVPTIGQPVIDVESNILGNLGGPDVTNMAATFIGDLLINSERFTLFESGKHEYECEVKLTGFQIQQEATKYGLGWLRLITNVIPKFANWNELTNVDWSKAETIMTISCAVSLRIVNVSSDTREVVAAGEGDVHQTDTTKNISMEMLGFTHSVGETNAVAIKSGLIDLASYYALTNELPRLDRQLLKRQQSSPPPPTGTNAPLASAKPDK